MTCLFILTYMSSLKCVLLLIISNLNEEFVFERKSMSFYSIVRVFGVSFHSLFSTRSSIKNVLSYIILQRILFFSKKKSIIHKCVLLTWFQIAFMSFNFGFTRHLNSYKVEQIDTHVLHVIFYHTWCTTCIVSVMLKVGL